MRWPYTLGTLVLALGTAVAVPAQTAPPLDAAQLADAALGELPGTVAVGVLKDGKTQVVVRGHFPRNFTEAWMFEQATRYGRDGLWQDMGRHVLGRTPPCETKYSNFAYAVLGQALAERAQRPYGDLVLEGIARPLGLRDTGQQLSPQQQARRPQAWKGTLRAQPWDAGVFGPAGGLHATATDLLAFSQAVLQGRRGPLGAAAERLVTDLAPYGEQGARIAYGAMLYRGPERTVGHGGRTRGFSAEWIVWPDRQEAVVLLASNVAAPVGDIRRALVDGSMLA